MKKVLFIAALIFTISSIISIITLNLNERKLISDKNYWVNIEYLPGSLMLHGCRVDSSYYPKNGVLSCNLWDNELIMLTYNDKTRIILSTTYSMYEKNKTVGDFILLYGTPTGTYKRLGIMFVYFGDNRYIWTSERNFTPDSRVWFVSYSFKQDGDTKIWEGFKGF